MTEEAELVLNIAPVSFSSKRMEVGRLVWKGEDAYRALRDQHWQTHAFRYDKRYEEILNVTLTQGGRPLGQVQEVDLQEHLLLAAQAVQQSILIWIARGLRVLKKNNKRLLFLGRADEALLLSKAVASVGRRAVPGIEVVVRYETDCRMFHDPEDVPFLGLVIDVGAANLLDLPVSELMRRGLVANDRYVCRRRVAEHDYLHPGLELLGKVSGVEGDNLILSDTSGTNRIAAADALLEPRQEYLEAVVRSLYGKDADRILNVLASSRQPLVSANGKLARIRQTLKNLQDRQFTIADGIAVHFHDMLGKDASLFPQQVATERPILLFGAQGRNSYRYPDAGIRSWGPYMYMQHKRNTPLIAVVCEARHRGTVEQFVNALCTGYPDHLWRGKKENPYQGGLIGKFRLTKVRLEYEDCPSPSSEDYRDAARRTLARLPQTPDLAIVQIRQSFGQLRGDSNPYYAAKAAFMSAGVPVQAFSVEKMQPGYDLPYLLNTVAVASYAKLGGIPWVISTTGTTTHELVVGIGSAEVAAGRLGPRDRYVGITTVFHGDGRYLVWNQTREVPFEEYQAELLSTLRTAIRHVSSQQGWEMGDKVRLICHVFKRLKNAEVEAIKSLVRDLLSSDFEVTFAFLDISSAHPYRLFAPQQPAVEYWQDRNIRFKGQGVPERGVCLQIDRGRALLQLTGPREVKTEEQGLPQPLLLELHPESDFRDLVYLARQCYHFTYASWQSFNPASEPVTIKYSRLIAGLLGNLKTIRSWDSTVLAVGSLRDRCWFL